MHVAKAPLPAIDQFPRRFTFSFVGCFPPIRLIRGPGNSKLHKLDRAGDLGHFGIIDGFFVDEQDQSSVKLNRILERLCLELCESYFHVPLLWSRMETYEMAQFHVDEIRAGNLEKRNLCNRGR